MYLVIVNKGHVLLALKISKLTAPPIHSSTPKVKLNAKRFPVAKIADLLLLNAEGFS